MGTRKAGAFTKCSGTGSGNTRRHTIPTQTLQHIDISKYEDDPDLGAKMVKYVKRLKNNYNRSRRGQSHKELTYS